MAQAAATARGGWGWKRKLLLQLALLPLLLILVDAAFRVMRGYDGDAVRAELAESLRQVDDRDPTKGMRKQAQLAEETRDWSLHPYFGFHSGWVAELFDREIDYYASGQGDASFDVLVVGGSVAANFGNMGWARLAERLRQDPRLAGRELHLSRGARASYKQPQQLALVTYALQCGMQPDVVLNLDGFNEVALGRYNATLRTHPSYPSMQQWQHISRNPLQDEEGADLLLAMRAHRDRAMHLAQLGLDWRLTRSAVLGRWIAAEVRGEQRGLTDGLQAYTRFLARAQSPALRGPKFDEPTAIADNVAAWARCSRAIDAICAARGITYLHVLQPTLHDPGSGKPRHPDELAGGDAHPTWLEGVGTGYPLLRAAGAELAARGIAFLDGSRAFADVAQPLYYDNCHFGPEGNELLAECIATALLQALPAELPR